MRRFFLFVILAIISTSSGAFSQKVPPALKTDIKLEKSFIYADLVVEGIVDKVSTISVPHKDIMPDIPGPNIPVAIITFKVNQVLIGNPQPEYIKVFTIKSKAANNYFDIKEEDKYILSLRYGGGEKDQFLSGKYILRMNQERFLIDNSHWVQGRKDKPIAKGNLSKLYDSIERSAAKRNLKDLTKRADLIVRGVVENTAWVDSSGAESGIRKVTLEVKSVIKGSVEGDSLVIALQTRFGKHRPNLEVLVPPMHIGEEWITFLKYSDDPGYYPFAGVNGLFLVKGDSIIRNNWNELMTGYSLPKLELNLRKIVSQEE